MTPDDTCFGNASSRAMRLDEDNVVNIIQQQIAKGNVLFELQ